MFLCYAIDELLLLFQLGNDDILNLDDDYMTRDEMDLDEENPDEQIPNEENQVEEYSLASTVENKVKGKRKRSKC